MEDFISEDFILPEKHCPVCGKEFYPADTWVYKRGRVSYCSWKCLRAEEACQQRNSGKKYHYKKIEQYTLDGDLVKTYDNAKEAAAAVNTSPSYIQEICRGLRNPEHMGRNYIWRYKNELPKMQKQKSNG